jgi:hypothetical protein
MTWEEAETQVALLIQQAVEEGLSLDMCAVMLMCPTPSLPPDPSTVVMLVTHTLACVRGNRARRERALES